MRYTLDTAASSTSRKQDASLFLTTMLAKKEASTATYARASVSLLLISVLHLSRCLTPLSCSGCSEATKPSGHFFLSGAIRLYDQSVFNSYGTVSFVSNEAGGVGGEMRDRNACTLWRLEMSNELPFATPESGRNRTTRTIRPHSQIMYTVAQTKHRKFCPGFVIVR